MRQRYTAAPMARNQPAATATALPEEDLPTKQAYLKLARCLRRLGQPICGLWPVSSDTEFEEVPRNLANALASLGVTVAVVVRPALWRDDPARNQLSAAAVGEGVDALVPVRERTVGLGTVIEQTLALACERYQCILLDLSGLDAIGAQEVALVPGVGIVLFVPSGRISEHALARLRRRLPTERVLGAVLLDVERKKGVAVA
jgi:hypothetical protein